MSCDQCNGCAAGAGAATDGGAAGSAGAAASAASGAGAAAGGASAARAPGARRIALLGQPNSGKSTLFNGLTGARQHVGNWPGKTVERKTGTFQHGGRAYEVVDLPGSYALSAMSPEEEVTRGFLAQGGLDAVLVLADASQLERSLYMLADFAGISCPAVLVLNLMDVAEGQGKRIDAAAIERRLGVPVVPLVAADRTRYDALYQALERTCDERAVIDPAALERAMAQRFGSTWDAVAAQLPEEGIGPYSRFWLAAKLIEGDGPARELVQQHVDAAANAALDKALRGVKDGIQNAGAARFAWVEQLIAGAVEREEEAAGGREKNAASAAGSREAASTASTGNAKTASPLSRFDRLATGSLLSKPLAVGMILLGFVLAFVPAIPIMMVGGMISSIGQEAAFALSGAGIPDVVGSFLSGVVCNSLCFGTMMVGYVFGINLVFGLYEESGYMARISYVFDHAMSRFGLQGKSLMPFLMCFGCTMGGVSGSRVIDSWGQRMLTVMMAWAIPCGSTWGVVPVLAVAFFGMGAPLVIVGIFCVCVLLMWAVGRLFGPRLVKEGERAGLVMELPPYHRPRLGNVLHGAILKSRQMFVRAIRVVAIFAFAIWALTYTATGSVEGSALYALGTAIEPVTQFFGMGWQTFTAWLCALVLKESALGVLSGLFAGGATPNAAVVTAVTGGVAVAGNIGEIMAQAISAPEALAFIFAFTFNMPCAASVSATWGEVHSTKWTVITAAFYIASSLILGCIVFHAASLFF